MLTPQRRLEIDQALGTSRQKTMGMSPERRAQIDSMLVKTPAKKTMSGFLNNVGESYVNLVGDTVKIFTDLPGTAKSIIGLGSGIIQLLIPGEQGNEKLAKAVGQFYVNRYGSLEKAANSLYNDPAGVAADVAGLLSGGGAAFKVSGASKVAGGLSRASKIIDPLNVASKINALPTRFKPNFNAMSKAGKSIEDYGRTLPTRGLGLPAQRRALEKGGVKIEKLMEEFPDLYTRDPEVANLIKSQVGEKYSNAGLRPDISIDQGNILNKFDAELVRLRDLADRGSAVALQEFDELLKIKINLAKDLADNPSLEGIIKFKRDIIQPNKPAGAFDPKSYSGDAKAYTTGYEIIKDVGIDANPELNNLGKKYRTLQGLPDLFEKYQSRGQGNQLFRVPKMAATGAGGAIGGIPGAIAGFLTEQLVNSPEGVKIASQVTQKLGKTLQKPIKIPNKFARPAQITYDVARTSRLLSPSGVSQGSQLSSSGQNIPTDQREIEKTIPQGNQPQTPSYAPIIPSERKPLKSPSNVFKNKSSFGSVPRIRVGNFK